MVEINISNTWLTYFVYSTPTGSFSCFTYFLTEGDVSSSQSSTSSLSSVKVGLCKLVVITCIHSDLKAHLYLKVNLNPTIYCHFNL